MGQTNLHRRFRIYRTQFKEFWESKKTSNHNKKAEFTIFLNFCVIDNIILSDLRQCYIDAVLFDVPGDNVVRERGADSGATSQAGTISARDLGSKALAYATIIIDHFSPQYFISTVIYKLVL